MDRKYTEDDFVVISSAEAIRLRPQMYFRDCFLEKTLDSLPIEALCHAFDEYFDGVCKSIEISVTNDSFTVSYDAGISLEIETDCISKAEAMMTQVFACRNEKKHLAVGEEFCQLGLATIQFATERSELTTVCGGKKGDFKFEKGITTSSLIDVAENPIEFTKIFMKPDQSIFGNLSLTVEGILERVRQLDPRFPDLNIVVRNDNHLG